MRYIKNTNQYIIFCFIALFLLLGLNSFFFVMKEAFGYGEGTFLFTSADRFADIIKTSLSYKEILLKIPNFNNIIDNLSPLYQNYFHNNPYGGITGLDGLSHFHMPPIAQLLNIIVAAALGYGLTPTSIMFTLFLFCMFLMFFSTYYTIRSYKKSLLIIILIIISYPLLMIVTRGNYSAFFSGIGVLAFLNSLFINKKINILNLFLYSVAINFRPNAAILLLAFPLLFGIRKSIWPVSKVILLSLSVFIFTYLLVNFIYPAYTIITFLKGLSVYNKLYVLGNDGLAFNSSLFGIFKIGGILVGINISTITWMFYISSAFILLALGRFIIKKNAIIAYYPFILSSIYILLNPIAADYHLLIFFLPIITIYNNFEYWQNDKTTLQIITLSTLLILSPKNYLFVHGISLQVIINPLIMIYTIIYLFYKNEIKRLPKPHSYLPTRKSDFKEKE